MHDATRKSSTPKPSARILSARARGQALIDLSKKYPLDFRRFYLIRKKEQFTKAGVPLNRRHIRHTDDGIGFCQACGNVYPCTAARRRKTGNEAGGE